MYLYMYKPTNNRRSSDMASIVEVLAGESLTWSDNLSGQFRLQILNKKVIFVRSKRVIGLTNDLLINKNYLQACMYVTINTLYSYCTNFIWRG